MLAALACTASVGACAGAQSGQRPAPLRELWGFTAFWDPRSLQSLARNGDALSFAVTTWIALDTLTSAPTMLFVDSATKPVPRRMALLTSWFGERFHPASVRRLAADDDRLGRAAAVVAHTMNAAGNRGLVIDFEGHVASDRAALLEVVRTLADTLAAHDLGPVTVAIPATDTLAYPARDLVAAGAHFVLPMLYDQHWAGGEAGPVAAPDWVSDALGRRVREVGGSRVVAGLPLYGYRWSRAGAGATVTHAEAVEAATAAGVALSRDSATATLRAMLPGSGEIWVTDAELLRRLMAVVSAAGVERVALWHLGQEDRSVWPLLRRLRADER